MLRTEPFGVSDFSKCLPLLRGYPYQPYAYYTRQAGPEAIERLFLARVERALTAEGAHALWVPGDQGPRALAIWRRQGWDSDQLGCGVARLDYLIADGDYHLQQELANALVDQLLADCSQDGISLLSARVDSSDMPTLHLLERRGFFTVDALLQMSVEPAKLRSPSTVDGYHLRLCTPQDIEPIKKLARVSYDIDRFHADPSVPRQVADEIYAVWMENACLGRIGDVVFVGERDGRLVSYMTCGLDHESQDYLGFKIGILILAAAAPEARGQGLGRALYCHTIGYLGERGARFVELGTQLKNIPAMRMFVSMGMTMVGSSVTLHRWLR